MKNGKNLVTTQLLPEKLTVLFSYSHCKETSQLKKKKTTDDHACIIMHYFKNAYQYKF